MIIKMSRTAIVKLFKIYHMKELENKYSLFYFGDWTPLLGLKTSAIISFIALIRDMRSVENLPMGQRSIWQFLSLYFFNCTFGPPKVVDCAFLVSTFPKSKIFGTKNAKNTWFWGTKSAIKKYGDQNRQIEKVGGPKSPKIK